jgi:membrane protein implicated in regulation of membrane protease activity
MGYVRNFFMALVLAVRAQLFGRRWMRELDRQPIQLFQRKTDLGLRLGTLRRIQFHRGATQTAVGAAHHRDHHVQIAR